MNLFKILSVILLTATVPIRSSQACFFDPCHPFCQPLVWQTDEMTCDLNADYWPSLRFADNELKRDLVEGDELSLEHFRGFQLPQFHESQEYIYIADLLLVLNPEGKVEAIHFRDPCKPSPWEPSEEELERCRLALAIDARLVELHKNWAFEPGSITQNQTCSLVKLRYILSAREPDGNGGHLYRGIVGTVVPDSGNN